MELIRLVDGKTVKSVIPPSFDMTCQVLVVGAGSAGVYAADAAAQKGCRVLLLENDVTVGGMHILGGVHGCYYGLNGGSFEADTRKSKASESYRFPVDKKRLCMLERLEKHGAALRCGWTPTGLLAEDGKVLGVMGFDGEREMAIGADVTVDATSDGFLIRMLPVEKTCGREYDGKMAPFSVISRYYDGEIYRQVNRDAGYVDPYDSEDFSQKALQAHARSMDVLEKGEFLNLAYHTGVREGLRFKGEQTLNLQQTLLGQPPEKLLFWAYSDLDIHGSLRALDDPLFQTWWVVCNLSTVTVKIPVGMGCVIPKGWKGIATAGRCLSADHYMYSAVRMNRDMFRMGQCVGTAAAMAVDTGGDLLGIDYTAYLEQVRCLGCFGDTDPRSFGFTSPHRGSPYTPLLPGLEENLHLLKTDTPGAAFWAAYRCTDRSGAAQSLLGLLPEAEDTLYRYNIAIALGLLENKQALPLLREMVENRDGFFFRDCRRSNQFRSVAAVCLLGRLGEREDAALLERIVFDPEEPRREIYRPQEDPLYPGKKDRNFGYFQVFTHAAAALVALHRRWEIPVARLHEKLSGLLQSGEAVRRIAPHSQPGSPARAETEDLLKALIRETA